MQDGTGNQPNTLPAGMTQTPPSTLPGADFGNQDQSSTSIPGGGGFTGYPVTIGAGEENLTADFGYNYNPATDVNNGTGNAALGDRVWIDANGNGAQDPNEAGIAGVTVQIFTPGADGLFGTPDDVAGPIDTTDANGNYLFDGLTPGAYVVKVTPPAGYTQTGDPDSFGLPCPVCDNQTTTPVILAPGDVFLNADFGYQPPAGQNNSIGDTIWFDANANGVGPNGNGGSPGNDNTEYGIPGVTVALIQDTNGDGTWNAGEPIVATDTTDADGNYLFPGLPDGNYLVWVDDANNVLDGQTPTYDADGGSPPAGSGAPLGIDPTTVLGLSASALDPTSANGSPVDDLAQDFGYTAPGQLPTTGLIGDTIFFDADPGDGDAYNPAAGDTPIEGVVVELRDSANNLITTATTDENGNYYFGGLDPEQRRLHRHRGREQLRPRRRAGRHGQHRRCRRRQRQHGRPDPDPRHADQPGPRLRLPRRDREHPGQHRRPGLARPQCRRRQGRRRARHCRRHARPLPRPQRQRHGRPG